jgi:hypothetical protein
MLLAQITVTDAVFKEPLAGTRLYFSPERVGRQSPASRTAAGFIHTVIELACVVDSHGGRAFLWRFDLALLFVVSYALCNEAFIS